MSDSIKDTYNKAATAQAQGVPVNWQQLCLSTITAVEQYLAKLSAEHNEQRQEDLKEIEEATRLLNMARKSSTDAPLCRDIDQWMREDTDGYQGVEDE